MAYASGDIILDDHYNTFATGTASGSADNNVANINTVWGVGFGDKGYGQTTVLTAVSAGSLVTATQWSTMISRLNSILTHQSGSGSGITSMVTGDTIAYISTLSTRITTAYNNRALFATQGTPTSSNFDQVWTSDTPNQISEVFTFTFASADQTRYFFNAGGELTVTPSISAGAGTSKETSWSNLLNGIGTLKIGAISSTRSGTGYTPITINGLALGYWDLTTTDQTLIRLTDSTSAYSTNYVEVLIKTNGVQGSNGDNGNIVTVTVNLVDVDADQFNWGSGVDMTVRVAAGYIPPESVNLSATWSTPTVARAVIDIATSINLVGAVTASQGGNVLTLPTGTTTNDIVLCHATTDGTGALTLPTGYQFLYNEIDFGTGRVSAFYKVMGGSPDTSITLPVIAGSTWVVSTWRNVNTVRPINTWDIRYNADWDVTTNSSRTPEITPTVNKCMIVSAMHNADLDTIAFAPDQFSNVAQVTTTAGADSATAVAAYYQSTAGIIGGTGYRWENNDSGVTSVLADATSMIALQPAYGTATTPIFVTYSVLSNTSADSLVVPALSGVVNGDLIVAIGWGNDNATTQPTYPAGFTERSFNQYGFVASKIASSESGTYTFGWLNTASNITIILAVYRGVSNILTGSWETAASATTSQPPAITANAGVVIAFYVFNGASTWIVGQPAGMYTRNTFDPDVYNPIAYLMDRLDVPAGSFQPASITWDNGTAGVRSSILINLY